jgi:uncharacterized protein YecE (DUF72 family)
VKKSRRSHVARLAPWLALPNNRAMQLWVGTSGYSYPDWVGGFYPAGTSSQKMFTHYVRQFPLVELNYTFYRPAEKLSLLKLAHKAPKDFQFIVKLHRSLSHEHDLSGAIAIREAVDALQQENRLLGLLCQYPQEFHYTKQNLGRLDALARKFPGHTLAVEFRHHSWHVPAVNDWLGRRQLHLVSVDVPNIPSLYPRRLVHSSRLIYIRLHSRNKDAWYADDKSRYDYLYSDKELLEWIDALIRASTSADRALMLFNNCHSSQAAMNAQRVQKLLSQMETPLQVVPPPEWQPEEGNQKLLF